jgi:hypothetical protein
MRGLGLNRYTLGVACLVAALVLGIVSILVWGAL